MAITDHQAAVLRALLAGDFDAYDRLADKLDRRTDGDYGLLVAAAFFEAVDRRFAPRPTRSDVIRLVAKTRERFDPSGTVIDPEAAERLVLSVFDEVSLDDVDDKTLVLMQVVLLGELITAQNLGSEALDEFMASAREIAQEWAQGA